MTLEYLYPFEKCIVGLKGENSALLTDGIHDVRGFP
jgi:hypothetical protein